VGIAMDEIFGRDDTRVVPMVRLSDREALWGGRLTGLSALIRMVARSRESI